MAVDHAHRQIGDCVADRRDDRTLVDEPALLVAPLFDRCLGFSAADATHTRGNLGGLPTLGNMLGKSRIGHQMPAIAPIDLRPDRRDEHGGVRQVPLPQQAHSFLQRPAGGDAECQRGFGGEILRQFTRTGARSGNGIVDITQQQARWLCRRTDGCSRQNRTGNRDKLLRIGIPTQRRAVATPVLRCLSPCLAVFQQMVDRGGEACRIAGVGNLAMVKAANDVRRTAMARGDDRQTVQRCFGQCQAIRLGQRRIDEHAAGLPGQRVKSAHIGLAMPLGQCQAPVKVVTIETLQQRADDLALLGLAAVRAIAQARHDHQIGARAQLRVSGIQIDQPGQVFLCHRTRNRQDHRLGRIAQERRDQGLGPGNVALVPSVERCARRYAMDARGAGGRIKHQLPFRFIA